MLTRKEALEMYGQPDVNGHITRFSFDASSYDEICVMCGMTDMGIGRPSIFDNKCPYGDEDAR